MSTDKTEDRLSKLNSLLEAVEDAIYAVLAGQSYSLGSRSVTRADLGELRDMKREIQAEIDQIETNGSTRRKFRRVVPMN